MTRRKRHRPQPTPTIDPGPTDEQVLAIVAVIGQALTHANYKLGLFESLVCVAATTYAAMAGRTDYPTYLTPTVNTLLDFDARLKLALGRPTT